MPWIAVTFIPAMLLGPIGIGIWCVGWVVAVIYCWLTS